jgi:hypothetical protein
MFEFIDKDTYRMGDALIELKQALKDYEEARRRQLVTEQNRITAMKNFEEATSNNIVITKGEMINADNVRMSTIVTNPELRNMWIVADMEAITASADMEIKKERLLAIETAIKALTRT